MKLSNVNNIIIIFLEGGGGVKDVRVKLTMI
jgi:hypothetical protein